MPPSPYRTPPPATPEAPDVKAPLCLDVAVAAVLAWALAMLRVVLALWRGEGGSREVDFAWLLVVLAPIVVWKEIASQLPKRTEPR